MSYQATDKQINAFVALYVKAKKLGYNPPKISLSYTGGQVGRAIRVVKDLLTIHPDDYNSQALVMQEYYHKCLGLQQI